MGLQTFYERPKGRKKVTDDTWVLLLAERSGLSFEDARKFWTAQRDMIKESMAPDGAGILRIPGFGCFYRQVHKGHPLNLRNVNGGHGSEVKDYTLVKFKATDEFRNEAVGMPGREDRKVPES